MKESCMVEPYPLARFRMPGCHRSHLLCPQGISASPLEVNFRGAAVLLHCVPLFGLESVLPGESQTGAVVADVHIFLLHEALPDAWVEAKEHPARVRDRRRAASRGRLLAKETDSKRERLVVRLLGVRKDIQARRVIRRRVNTTTDRG